MTKPISGEELARHIRKEFPDAVEAHSATDVWVKPHSLLPVARLLKEKPELEMSFLNAVTGVDYVEYFEVVYHLTSIAHNHSAVLKTRVYGRDDARVPSVISLWQGADLQEREVWDLMGVYFDGHPNMKRILLWEGFTGHPLRRDYLEPPLPYTWPHGG